MTGDRALKVLSLGKDPTIFAAANGTTTGDARHRHIFYAQRLAERAPGSEMRVVTYTRRGAGQLLDKPSAHLTLYGTDSRSRATYVFDLKKRLRAVLADGWRPDVITSQEPWEEGLVAQGLARRCAARDVPQLHFDIMSDRWRSESALNGIKRLLARRVVTRAAHVRVVSEPLKRSLIDRWGVDAARISVTPVGVNFRRSALSREESRRRLDATLTDERVVLFVGRLVAAKNLTLWLEVAKHVLASFPATRFVLVGDGELRASLEERARELGISANVRFTGNRPHGELPDVYAAADVFLLTSHYEGFGRVVLEAMLAARPVVTTRCGGPEDLVIDGHNGFLAARDDAATLAARVCALLADATLAAELGARGASLAEERFGLPALADRLVDMWQRA